MRSKKIKSSGMLVLLLEVFHLGIAHAEETLVTMPLSNNKQTDCTPVRIIEPTKHKPRSFVTQTLGRYCLMEDLVFTNAIIDVFPSLIGVAIQQGAGGWFGFITPGTKLDLGGHALRSNFNGVNGLSITGSRSGFSESTEIRNGAIILSGGEAIHAQNTYHSLWFGTPHQIDNRNIPGTSHLYQAARDGYVSTQITLENLDISVNDSAIFLEGNDNIIRNCKIRVKGSNAIQIFGNNVQILNNEIIVESEIDYSDEKIWGKSAKDIRHFMAPIMLRDGDNALISGNKITIKGDEVNRPSQAISLRDSRNVRIENNRFIDAQFVYKAFEAFNVESTAIESNNSLKSKAGWFD